VHTALTPMRRRLDQQFRPDFILRDDFENAITSGPPVGAEKIIRLLDEAKDGVAAHRCSLTIGNFIIENGVMGYVRKSVDGSWGRVRFILVINWQGQLSWPDKYVKTDADPVATN